MRNDIACSAIVLRNLHMGSLLLVGVGGDFNEGETDRRGTAATKKSTGP